MMSLSVVFWLFIIFFGVVGAFRGWAKEILVVFSMILALTLIWALRKWGPGVEDALLAMSASTQFTMMAFLILMMAYFGYQTPGLPPNLMGKLMRDKLQDTMLGVVLGMVNGYFVIGTLWAYMDQTGYPFSQITPPIDPDVINYIQYMPPYLLSEQYLVFALIAAFAFVIIVFV